MNGKNAAGAADERDHKAQIVDEDEEDTCAGGKYIFWADKSLDCAHRYC